MRDGLRAALETWFNRQWYERATPLPWLLPASQLYGYVMRLRDRAYASGWFKSTRIGCPIVVVGNLTVGGTGKTPLVCWLVEQLGARGLKPGIAARGYGGSAQSAHLLQAGDSAARVGDEAVLLKLRTQVPVAVGRRRAEACQLLLAAGCNVIVCDDGLQHRALRRDCEIVVVDVQRGFGNGALLPAGPLREVRTRLGSVDAVVINGEAADGAITVDGAFSMRVVGAQAHLIAGDQRRPLSDFSGESVHAVAGIGNPARFFDMLRRYGMTVTPHPLRDHAPLTAKDIVFRDPLPVLMTEKDAVKCASIAGPAHWYAPVSAWFDTQSTAALMQVIMKRIDSNG